MDKNSEFIRSSKDGWSVKLDLPDELKNVVWPEKINKISLKDGLYSQKEPPMSELNNARLAKKIKNDINKLDITFSDNLDAYNSMLKIAYESFKPELDGFLKDWSFVVLLASADMFLKHSHHIHLRIICISSEVCDLS